MLDGVDVQLYYAAYSCEYLLLTVVVAPEGGAWMRVFSLCTVGSISCTE